MRLAIVACLLMTACAEQLAPASQGAQQSEGTATQMDEARFWSLIDASAQGSPPQEVQEARLGAALSALSADDIAAFDQLFRAQVRKAYSWDLWGAAYIIHGGASDDGFEYFRRWLVSRGKVTFETALKDSDSLATLIPITQDEAAEFESFPDVAARVWESKTGINPYTATKDVGFFAANDAGASILDEPQGEPFEEDSDYLAKRWPNLSARFRDNPLF